MFIGIWMKNLYSHLPTICDHMVCLQRFQPFSEMRGDEGIIANGVREDVSSDCERERDGDLWCQSALESSLQYGLRRECGQAAAGQQNVLTLHLLWLCC